MNLPLMTLKNNLKNFFEDAKEIIKNQLIDENNPGPILKDFNTFLSLVKKEGIEVSGKNSLFPLKLLPQLNSYLTNPTLIDLKRPVQKSYPYLNGIYLLLRTTSIAYIIYEGKKQKLILDETTYQSWNQLNSTEQYLTLLEAWLIHAGDETIGESYSENNLLRCTNFWQNLAKDKIKINKNNQGYYSFNYSPGLHNLALLDLFGFIKLKQGKPETAKGWRITEIEKTVYGNTLLSILIYSLLVEESENLSPVSLWNFIDRNDFIKYGKLQKVLQPYFPQWQNNLILNQEKSPEGVYIFKVSLGKPWRQIAIPSHLDLDSLADIILDAFDFDRDHLYQFTCKQRTGAILNINHPYIEEKPFTNKFSVGELPLQKGGKMTFLFDFGDNWEFDLILEEIQAPDPKLKKPTILKSYGKAPEQYDYDDQWDEEE
jgi:hypothetical protein